MISRRTLTLFVLSSVLFGGTFVAVKAGLEYFPPLLFVAMRFDVAAVLMLVYTMYTVPRDEFRPQTKGDVTGILATGGLVIGLTNALLFVGQQYATSAVGAIIFSLNPILTPVFAAVLLSNERLSSRGAAGMLIGLLGVGLVVNPDPAMILGGGAVGKAILFAGAVSAALGAVLIRRADATLSSTVRVTWGLPLAAALCHTVAVVRGESAAAITWSPTAILALVYVGVFAGALAYLVYFALLDETGAIEANLVFYVVPVVSTLGGWALLGERIAPLAILGFLTIFMGFAVIGSKSIDIQSRLPSLDTVRVWSDCRPDDRSSITEEPQGYRSD